MAKSDGYGYRRGNRRVVAYPLDADAADIAKSTAITKADATAGYFKEVDAAGERVSGFATASVLSGAADGDKEVLVDISNESVYEFPPDAGTVSLALIGSTCDIGADGRTIDIDGSADDSLMIVDVNLTRNTVYVRLRDAVKAPGVA
ncbi:MAG: hypothetical protein AAFV53_31785 [Myxococcota bacterium]